MLPQKVTRNSCPLGNDLMYESKGTDSLTTCGPGEESPDHDPKSVSPVPGLALHTEGLSSEPCPQMGTTLWCCHYPGCGLSHEEWTSNLTESQESCQNAMGSLACSGQCISPTAHPHPPCVTPG